MSTFSLRFNQVISLFYYLFKFVYILRGDNYSCTNQSHLDQRDSNNARKWFKVGQLLNLYRHIRLIIILELNWRHFYFLFSSKNKAEYVLLIDFIFSSFNLNCMERLFYDLFIRKFYF